MENENMKHKEKQKTFCFTANEYITNYGKNYCKRLLDNIVENINENLRRGSNRKKVEFVAFFY